MASASDTRPVYRIVVHAWPEGSRDQHGYPVWDWEPDGWQAGPYDDPQESSFRWPRHDRRFFSKGAAHKRAALMRSYGATVTVEGSAPIVWAGDH